MKRDLPPEIEALATRIVDAAFRVHRGVGQGCPEPVYHRCLGRAFEKAGLRHVHEFWIDIDFDGLVVPRALRVDFMVEGIPLEVKAVPALTDAHEAQAITYLRWSRSPIAFLVNFHSPTFAQGIRRYVSTPRSL